MGMFDYLKCEREMPDGIDGRSHLFQTKDFNRWMDVYEITEAGRLLQPIAYGAGEKMHDMHYHGSVNFYTLVSKPFNRAEWHEYSANFVEGQLVEITCVPENE